jgi:hypothetical protein
MSVRTGRGRGAGLLNRIILLVILIPLAVLGIAYFFSPSGPFRTQSTTPAPAPITIGQIQKLYRLETAQITGQTIIEGQTGSALPFSSAKITYQVILTMTAGIDMSQLKDTDIQSDGETLTIMLPAPQVLSETSEFVPIAENKEILSGPSEKKDLPKLVVDEGKKRVHQSIIEQGELFRQARTNAEDSLRNLIFQIAPQYKKIIFLQPATASPSVKSNPSPTGLPK